MDTGAQPRPLMPKSMVMQQWKRGPGGATSGTLQPFDQGAASLLRAWAVGKAVRPRVGGPLPPTLRAQVAASTQGALRMPEEPSPIGPPVLRRLLPNDPAPRLAPPDATEHALSGLGRAAARGRARGLLGALQSVGAQQQQIQILLGKSEL